MTSSHLLPRDFGHRWPMIVRAEGIRVWDADGREYLDSVSGSASVTSVGYGRREVVDAMAEQAMRVAYVHDMEFHNEPATKLAARVVDFAGGDFSRAAFFSSGSDAIESAIKLARNYHILNGDQGRDMVISRRRSFHGATLFALAVGGVTVRKSRYLGYMSSATAQIPAPYCYRCPLGLEYPACGLACAEALEELILELGPDNVSAFIAEPVVAAGCPGLTPPPGYFEAIGRICRKYGVVWIADEIITGFGRTGRNFGYQHWDAQPDILAIAKGISGGYVPLSGIVVSDRLVRSFEAQGAKFIHGLTYQNHPVACAAGLAVLDIIEREHLVENAAIQGRYLETRMRELAARLPMVGEVRGLGMLWAMELVRDRETREPFDRSIGLATRITERAFDNGLVIYQSGDAFAHDEVFISPPLVATRDDIDEIMARFGRTLEEAQADVLGSKPGDAERVPVGGATR